MEFQYNQKYVIENRLIFNLKKVKSFRMGIWCRGITFRSQRKGHGFKSRYIHFLIQHINKIKINYWSTNSV